MICLTLSRGSNLFDVRISVSSKKESSPVLFLVTQISANLPIHVDTCEYVTKRSFEGYVFVCGDNVDTMNGLDVDRLGNYGE